jgi:hypothetical protein
MSNPYISRIKKDLVPRVIMGGSGLYLGFVHESAKKPLKYYDFLFLWGFGKCEECMAYANGDFIYKLGISSYFELNDKIMRSGLKYNLMKKRHEYNQKKYGKIRSNSNTV